MNTLLLQAIKKAGQMRAKLKLSMFSPVNIFDGCVELGVIVRFVDISMEGMYIHQAGAINQFILISSLRPFPRRVYTCAHELGHHIFGHGSKIDGLNEEAGSSGYDKEEYLVDAFAGAFLMPVAAVEAEFIKRSWQIGNCTPIQFYTVSSVFGCGYSTLIKHCKANILISENKAFMLLKQSPSKLLKDILGKTIESSHFKIIDEYVSSTVVDLEVGNYLFLPSDVGIEGDHLYYVNGTDYGNMYIAKKPGIVRTVTTDASKGYFIRIQNSRYIGLAENRHLEDKID